MKKKIILLAICLFSVFAFFTACNGDKKQTQTGTATGERDFGGRKFYYRGTVITADPSDDDPDIDPGTLPYMESREDEVLYNQCLYIEKAYNCKIIRSGFSETTQTFATMFAAGDIEADICSATFGELREYTRRVSFATWKSSRALTLPTRKNGASRQNVTRPVTAACFTLSP